MPCYFHDGISHSHNLHQMRKASHDAPVGNGHYVYSKDRPLEADTKIGYSYAVHCPHCGFQFTSHPKNKFPAH